MATKNTEKDDSRKMSREEAGRKGGETTAAKHGDKFYSEIGHEGGKSQGKDTNPGNFANRPKDEVRKAAQEGGRNSHRGDSKD
jgi:general stress protein YciG